MDMKGQVMIVRGVVVVFGLAEERGHKAGGRVGLVAHIN